MIRCFILGLLALGLAAASGLVLGCVPSAATKEPAPVLALADKADPNWTTIRGQVVFAGDKIPERVPLPVKTAIKSDEEHCLEKGPLLSEKWIVNAKNNGVRWAVVFLKSPPDAPIPIHDSLKEVEPKELVIDQPRCGFDPHVFIVRKGQKLVAKNTSPIAHNITITGRINSYNRQTPPGKSEAFDLLAETNAVKVSCGAHPWMEGYTWIIDHPYYAVTDADGKFEIKLAPTGKRNLVIWHEGIGYVGGAAGKAGLPVEIKSGEAAVDLGKFEIKPE